MDFPHDLGNALEDRRLLVVAYYFPPLGLSGVQRVTKFVKYLPDMGWAVDVLTVKPGAYFAYDESLLRDVTRPDVNIYRTSSLDPTRLFGGRTRVSLPKEGRRQAFAWISQLIAQPDNKIGWMPFALRAGRRLIRRHEYDAVFSSAPPYTAHLVARRLAGYAGVPFYSDFRDDWLRNPRHEYPTAFHRRISGRMQNRVLSDSKAIIAINRTIADSLTGQSGEKTTHVIPQGFDPEDFRRQRGTADRERFTLLYTGVFYDAQRPDTFLRGLAQFISDNPGVHKEVQARFVGLFPEEAHKMVRSLGLSEIVYRTGYLPHDDVIEELRSCSLCWMTIGKRSGSEGISTGKLFEYMGSRKPILALIPEGEARRSLAGYGASSICDPDSVEDTASAIAEFYSAWKNDQLPTGNKEYIRQFDRRAQAKTLAAILAGH